MPDEERPRGEEAESDPLSGRSPRTVQSYHPSAYSMWLAGGGIKGGQVIGKADELGFFIEEDPIHVHDHTPGA
jgi:hypothetical protein